MKKLMILIFLFSIITIAGCSFTETTADNGSTTISTNSLETTYTSVTDRTSNTALNSTDTTTEVDTSITESTTSSWDTGLTTTDGSTITTFPTSVTATFVIWTTTVLIEDNHEQLIYDESNYLNPGSMDFYELNIVDDGTLLVYSTGSMDLFGYLYANDCTLLTYDDDLGAEDNFQIEIGLAPGTYYLAVESYSESQEGEYGLVVNFTVNGPTSYMRLLSYEGLTDSENTDWFEFYLYEPSYIDAYTLGELNTYGTLYTNGYEILAENDDFGDESNFLIHTYLDEGIYYLAVSNEGEGEYQLKIDYVQSTVTHLFRVERYLNVSEEYTFDFILLEDAYISIMTLSSIDMYASLYDSDDVLIVADDDNGIEHNIYIYTFLEAGIYSLVLRSYEGDEEGDFVLIIDSD